MGFVSAGRLVLTMIHDCRPPLDTNRIAVVKNIRSQFSLIDFSCKTETPALTAGRGNIHISR